MASRSQIRAQHLVSLPSVSCSLSSLPNAKSADQVIVHSATSAKRAADSEAKLQKAISTTSRNSQSGTTPTTLMSNTPGSSSSESSSPRSSSPPPLTMRTPLKPKSRS